jgi:hypothetical protein
MTINVVYTGFSLLNRWLLYTSFMLSPAQLISGIGSNCPSNLGFLAYNWYTQVQWYRAVQSKQLHALSLLPVHFNMIYLFTYLGGISSGNIPMAILLGLGTAGVMVLNTIAAWTAWATNQPEGFGEFQFFFLGWRTLTPGWHKFFLLWQISDSMMALGCVITALVAAVSLAAPDAKEKLKEKLPWWSRYPAIPVGAVIMMFIGWPLVLWTELIYARNHIESSTDWVAVWLFVAQVVALVLPSCTATLSCFRRAK